MAFSKSPMRAAVEAIPKIISPPKTCNGMYEERSEWRTPGKMKEMNPKSHWRAKQMTADKPIQLCNVYKLSMGGSARLCESKTALSPIEASKRAVIIMTAWSNFSFFFGSLRSKRYTRMPINITHQSEYVPFYYSSPIFDGNKDSSFLVAG